MVVVRKGPVGLADAPRMADAPRADAPPDPTKPKTCALVRRCDGSCPLADSEEALVLCQDRDARCRAILRASPESCADIHVDAKRNECLTAVEAAPKERLQRCLFAGFSESLCQKRCS